MYRLDIYYVLVRKNEQLDDYSTSEFNKIKFSTLMNPPTTNVN